MTARRKPTIRVVRTLVPGKNRSEESSPHGPAYSDVVLAARLRDYALAPLIAVIIWSQICRRAQWPSDGAGKWLC